MHILTKIFVILVCLLAIFMVPLVVVSTLNQAHWRAAALDSQTQLQAARSDLSQHRQQAEARMAALQQESTIYSQRAQAQTAQIEMQAMQLVQSEHEVLEARSQLVSREQLERALTQSLETTTDLNKMLIDDRDDMRTRTVSAETRTIEINERLAQTQADLLASEDARKALKEDNQSLRQEQQSMEEIVARFQAGLGAMDGVESLLNEGIAPDRTLDAVVVNVERGDNTLVEIDAGSRDGVKEGWIMTIGDGGTYIGRLRISHVDLNRSTGVLTLEDPQRGLARPGHTAHALEGDG
ncbi:MAG: hypothetical protein MK101_06265 [Phycisphaerales bacterium]|nr:hypothetical protein [Phycisphaerales bacterium]